MAGYIAITTPAWIENNKSTGTEAAVFWSKKTTFKAVDKGEPFYFLRRGRFNSNADRYIAGRGLFVRFIRLNPMDAWNLFGEKLGFESKGAFEENVSSLYHGEIQELGCIVLEKVKFFFQEISLEECKIDFSPYIVSGKKLSDSDCIRIEEAVKE